MLDNVNIAVLTKVNELAERHGLKPYDFVATFNFEEDAKRTRHVLDFEVPASGNALREERFDKMLRDLGIVANDRASLIGKPSQIIEALDQALNISPRPRRMP